MYKQINERFMKIAFLVAAHTDIEQLKRLSKSLLKNGDVYIHIDAKVKNITDFINQLTFNTLSYSQGNKIIFLKNRVSVAWGGYSQIKCQSLLFQQALNSSQKYERFVYLSGLDYPIYSPKEIQTYFEKYPDTEFVCGYNISKSKNRTQLNRIQLYHFFRDIPLPHKSFIRRCLIGGTKLALKYLGFRRKPYLNINGQNWDIYYGSQWIGVTRQCAQYIMECLNNKYISGYFSTTYAPDELCIPTIVHNSPFKDKALAKSNLDFQEITPLHYLNYTDCIWTYDEHDFNTIVSSNKMFVRKLVSGKSEKLIDLLEKRKENIDNLN